MAQNLLMATKKPRLTIYLANQKIIDDLEEIAKEQQRSVSNLVSVICSEWIASYKSGSTLQQNHQLRQEEPNSDRHSQ